MGDQYRRFLIARGRSWHRRSWIRTVWVIIVLATILVDPIIRLVDLGLGTSDRGVKMATARRASNLIFFVIRLLCKRYWSELSWRHYDGFCLDLTSHLYPLSSPFEHSPKWAIEFFWRS